MSKVKLFSIGPVLDGVDARNALGLLETQMNVFMLELDIEIKQVNGPYVHHLSPKESLPNEERLYYTANILYDGK